MSIIAFINQKGGVGKSILSFNIGTMLSFNKKKVLFIDLDAQSTLTDMAIPSTVPYQATLFDVLKSKMDIKKAIVHTENYDILPGDIQIASLEHKLDKNVLKKIIEVVSNDYDYIILDCPPALGMMNITALYAADTIISVVKPDIVSTRGLSLLNQTIKNEVPGKTINAVVINQYKKRKISDLTIEIIKQDYPVLNTVIRDTSALAEAASISKSIVEYAKNSNGYKDIEEATNELLTKGII
jgi:sporulation initiation inhibitor protein Soj|nr:MAG TPA: ParA [Caudoviricetes sp.]